MADRELINAFEDCINRLRAGETIETCLRRYPHYATTLRPMLEAGLLVRRIGPSAAEISQAQDRIRHHIQDAVRGLPARPPRPLPARWVQIVAALVLIVIAGAIFAVLRDDDDPPAATRQPVATVATVTATPSPTLTLAPRETATFTATPTATLTATATATLTAAVTASPTETTGTTSDGGLQPVVESPTVTASPTATSTARPSRTPTFTATATRTPRPTRTATSTPSATATAEDDDDDGDTVETGCFLESAGLFDVRIRTGGSTDHPVIGLLLVGEDYPVIGFNPSNGIWYAVPLGEGETGWLAGSVTRLQGDCEDLPRLEYPPAPPNGSGDGEGGGSGEDDNDNSGSSDGDDDDDNSGSGGGGDDDDGDDDGDED